ncbi:MAG: hypothetical protein RLZZ383_1276 [Pseudomonadota bacterium]|jgi:hypothetical protein
MTLPRPSDALDHLSDVARHVREGHLRPTLGPLPTQDLWRSPVAARIATLAAENGLFAFHFEDRAHLDLPLDWVHGADATLAEAPTWQRGVLPESKYQSFRHDLMVASFHPGHRGKWTTHELAHLLVGYAWAPDATPWFHATAGRLAELLPVAVWYMFDEAYAARCPDHGSQGRLGRVGCDACEAAAFADPNAAPPREGVAEGLAFMERELAAIARSRRLGRPISNDHGGIDLCGDGVDYARAHSPRLLHPGFRAAAERLLIPVPGASTSIEALEARVVDVCHALLLGAPLSPWSPTPTLGRLRWTLQDVGMRIAQIQADTDGDLITALDACIDRLAVAVADTHRPETDPQAPARALTEARSTWEALCEDWDLPSAATVFGLGYTAPGATASGETLAASDIDALPLTRLAMGDRAAAHIADAHRATSWQRTPAPRRIAAALSETLPSTLRALARWEAALAALPETAPDSLDGAPQRGPWICRPGVLCIDAPCDVLRLAERVEAGAVDGVWHEGAFVWHAHDGHPVDETPQSLVLARDRAGDVLLLDVDPATTAALRAAPVLDLDPEEETLFLDLGLLIPMAMNERSDV